MLNKSANQILLEAAALLEKEDRWAQHIDGFNGAIFYCGSKVYKDMVDSGKYIRLNLNYYSFYLILTAPYGVEYFSRVLDGCSPEEYIKKHYKEVGVAFFRAMKVQARFDFKIKSKEEYIPILKEAAAS